MDNIIFDIMNQLLDRLNSISGRMDSISSRMASIEEKIFFLTLKREEEEAAWKDYKAWEIENAKEELIIAKGDEDYVMNKIGNGIFEDCTEESYWN